MKFFSCAWLLSVGLFATGCDQGKSPNPPVNPTKVDSSKLPDVSKAAETAKPDNAGKTIDNTKSDATKPDAPTSNESNKVAGPVSIPKYDLAADPRKFANEKNKPADWAQWGGSSLRNNTPEGKGIPTEWDVGDFDDNGEWKVGTGKNVKWVARLGSQSYGNPVVANGRVIVGTNNGKGWLKRYPAETDLGCLLCFDANDGKFLWQDSSEKLPQGRVVDWPDQGICCAACVEGDRLWYVSSRGEVKCLALNGNLNEAGTKDSTSDDAQEKAKEAKTLWVVNMMKEWGTSQHNMCSCSITIAGDVLFVNTSNGVDEGHINLPQPHAPCFVAINKDTGKIYWKDKTPGTNVLHGQWSSPSFAVIDGVPQVIFGGGDGWVYGFDARGDGEGNPKILWEFDANPKISKYVLGGRADRNHIIGTPVIYENKVYVAVGEDPEHAEGVGHLYGIDPTKRGDISLEIVVKRDDPNKTPIRHRSNPARRNQAVNVAEGEIAIPNPNSGALWHYAAVDRNKNGKIEFEETMHRTVGTCAIKNDLLYIADFSGLFHCVDAKTGKVHWTYDMKAETWSSPLIVEDKVYIGNANGEILVFRLSEKMEELAKNELKGTVYGTPIIANNKLYISSQNYLFQIETIDK